MNAWATSMGRWNRVVRFTAETNCIIVHRGMDFERPFSDASHSGEVPRSSAVAEGVTDGQVVHPILKVLAEVEPADWVTLSTGRRVRVFSSDVSSIGGAVDALLRVEAAVSWLLHLEFQTGHDGSKLPG